MRIKIKNLGALDDAEFRLGELTILCGENNTGKTYANYALYGFLARWRRLIPTRATIKDESCITSLMRNGTGDVNVETYKEKIDSILKNICKNYSKTLSQIFASSEDKFANSKFGISVDKKNISFPSQFEHGLRFGESVRLSVSKSKADAMPHVSLVQIDDESKIPQDRIKRIVHRTVIRILLDSVFPRVFIASAERTGTAIFRKELDFARNRLLKKMTIEKKKDPIELLRDAYEDYPLPVVDNLDFTREVDSISKKESFLSRDHPDVLKDFANITGGAYKAFENRGVFYKPKGKSLRLSMAESSSSVRSLMIIDFYLRHAAKEGDLLMIDEPELNLHPKNQRRIARLFVRLINLGMKVFITTDSDYIIKELNTLIMLKNDMPHLRKIVKQGGYKDEELLSSDKVKLYTAEKALVKLKNNKRRTRCHTLVPAEITQERGIEAISFDKTINEMNEIEEATLWGGEI